MNLSEGRTIFTSPRKSGTVKNTCGHRKRTTPTKQEKRLQARIDTFEREEPLRKNSPDGAYRRPGSLSK